MSGDGTRASAKKSFFVAVSDNNTGNIKRVVFTPDVQVGFIGNPAELHLTGRLTLAGHPYTLTTSSAPVTLSNNDTIAHINSYQPPGTPSIVFLPPGPRDWQVHFVKDGAGTAATNNIQVSGSSGTTIDGQMGAVISSSYGKCNVYWLAGAWYTLT